MSAVERYVDPGHELASVPSEREFTALWRQSEILAKSGMLLPHFRGKPEAVMAAALTCYAVGMPVSVPTINQFHDIQGRVQPSAQFSIALAAARGIELWFGDDECDSTQAVAYARRLPDGRVQKYRYTLEMAKAAGLAGKDVWKQHADVMLRYRAATRLLRSAFPDAMLGVPRAVLDGNGIAPVSRAALEANAAEVIDVEEPVFGDDEPHEPDEPVSVTCPVCGVTAHRPTAAEAEQALADHLERRHPEPVEYAPGEEPFTEDTP